MHSPTTSHFCLLLINIHHLELKSNMHMIFVMYTDLIVTSHLHNITPTI
jgi:hypothetical protein